MSAEHATKPVRARVVAIVATMAIVAPAPFLRIDAVRAAWKPVSALLTAQVKSDAAQGVKSRTLATVPASSF
jgi:hypothetical protein